MSLYRPGTGGTGGTPEDVAVTGEAIPPIDDARRRPVVVGGSGAAGAGPNPVDADAFYAPAAPGRDSIVRDCPC
jgi:hypothetical protein